MYCHLILFFFLISLLHCFTAALYTTGIDRLTHSQQLEKYKIQGKVLKTKDI